MHENEDSIPLRITSIRMLPATVISNFKWTELFSKNFIKSIISCILDKKIKSIK